MTLIKSISMVGGNSLESVSNSLINASNGQSSSDSNNQEQCFGFGRRRTTNIIFGDSVVVDMGVVVLVHSNQIVPNNFTH
ncbi:hypothetical protein PPL_01974 [Heterostelium album PN500]|uniref:Uncharacterized protein n=1 Tax=Heterostelium pallidum (strain ATCC 26659 / Pp 5 / PN500) TaxID=670386 RepID=D3B106_HETP5|nr:hypothetical protein PPL_01974 [Heterostelium album PN500]EFA84980.1 hypothetical protein PPL_01974 [Heterostelium album PN500]|eukprot:XP_020437090.1 hypothetical protein PPL_01974 [Heterostelium album PN500]